MSRALIRGLAIVVLTSPALAVAADRPREAPRRLEALAVSPDGRLIAAGGKGRAVFLFDARDGSLASTLEAPADVLALAFSPRPGDPRLAVGSEGDRLEIWADKGEGFRVVARRRTPGSPRALAFSADGGLLAAGTQGAGNILLIDPADATLRRRLWEPSNGIEAIAFAPDGKTVYTAGQGLSAWSLDRFPIRPGEAERDDLTLDELRDRGSKAVRWTASGNWVVGVACTRDGSKIVGSGHLGPDDREEPKGLALFDPAGARLRVLAEGPSQISSVAFSDDDRLVAAASEDGMARVWDVATGRPSRTLDAQAGPAWAIGFLPGGHRLAVATEDGAVRVWDADLGRILVTARRP